MSGVTAKLLAGASWPLGPGATQMGSPPRFPVHGLQRLARAGTWFSDQLRNMLANRPGGTLRLAHLHFENFRCFQLVDVALDEHVVLVGENKVGKSNLIHALRLLLDPTLPKSARPLRIEDFWDHLPRPHAATDRIHIWIDVTDFEHDPRLRISSRWIVWSNAPLACTTKSWLQGRSE